MDFQTKRKGIHYPSKLRASRVRRGHRARNRNGGASHGGAARLRGGELVGDCLAVEAGGWRTCTRLGAASHLPLWVGRSGVVAARLQGVAVVRAQAEACATIGEATHTPPTPRGSLYKYQRKGLTKKGVCKLLKIKGRFAQRLHRGTLRRREGAVRVWANLLIPPTPGVSCIDIILEALRKGYVGSC